MRGVPRNRVGNCDKCGKFFLKRGWRQRFCLSCRPEAYREYARKQNSLYYHRHPERVKLSIKLTRAKRPEYYKNQKRINQARRRERLRHAVLTHYSDETLSCKCCGERQVDFLTIDHIEGGGGKHRIALFGSRYAAGANFCAWLFKNQYPNGYQVLCMNCNFSKGKHGRCIHAGQGPTLPTEVNNAQLVTSSICKF